MIKARTGFARTPKLHQDINTETLDKRITIIIPARNEERDLRNSVSSLLQQSEVKMNILIVNDHSSDGTGNIADELAKLDSRVRVIHNPPLRSGWLGKCNASQVGANITDGELLLFCDADIIHAPGTLSVALKLFKKDECDLLSLIPRFIVNPFWENAMLPMYFTGMALFLTRDNLDPESAEAAASGAFILVKREVFEETGGFEPVRDKMYDDVEFAKSVKKQGYIVHAVLAPESISVEMFKSEKEAFVGTLKNVLMVGMGTPLLAIPALLMSFVMFWTPGICIATGIITNNPQAITLGATVYLLEYGSLYLCRRYFSFKSLRALLFPLSTIVASYCITKALYLFYAKGMLEWRGRQIVIRRTGS